MEQQIFFEINNHVYICQDVSNINDEEFITLMNSSLVSFGKYGHNLAVRGGINAINSLKPEPYLPELSTQKVREYLNLIETCQLTKKDNYENNDTDSDDELYFNPIKYQTRPGFSEIAGIDGEKIFSGQLTFS